MNLIKLEINNNNIATILLNRPIALNALNTEMLNSLDHTLDKLEKNKSLKVLIISGEGKAFVAGADISELSKKNEKEAISFAQLGHNVFNKIEKFKRPVIAAVNGFALGGGLELALACDFIVASENAKFSAPEVNLGLIPGFNGTQRLARKLGINFAKYMIFTARMLKADEAKKLGLAQILTTKDDLLTKTYQIAQTISEKGYDAVCSAKAVINYGCKSSDDMGSNFEIEKFGECFKGEEAQEGLKAFLEKRKPNW